MSASEIPRIILQNEYPDPKTLPAPPQPTQRQPLPLVTLSELIPGKYASTTARIVYINARKNRIEKYYDIRDG